MDQDIADGDYDTAALEQTMAEFAPGVLAFTGKRAAAGRIRFALDSGAELRTPSQDARGHLHMGPPFPSGAARGYWSTTPWLELARTYGTSRAVS